MIWSLLACSVSPGIDGGPRDTALPYTPSVATLDGEQAAARFQSVLEQGIPAGNPVVKTWMDLVDRYGDAECPDRVDYSMLDAPFGCEATTGAYFSGMTALSQDGGEQLLCDAYVLTPEGGRFDCGGESIQMRHGSSMWSLLIGTFGWVEQPLQEGGTFSAALTIETHSNGRIDLDGGVGHGDLAIQFLGLAWQDQVLSGAVGVHTEDGWYRSTLGPKGCGAWLYEDGHAVGQGCVDLAESVDAWASAVGL